MDGNALRLATYFSPTLLENNTNAVNRYLYGYLALLQILHFALVLRRETENGGRYKQARQRYKCHVVRRVEEGKFEFSITIWLPLTLASNGKT